MFAKASSAEALFLGKGETHFIYHDLFVRIKAHIISPLLQCIHINIHVYAHIFFALRYVPITIRLHTQITLVYTDCVR